MVPAGPGSPEAIQFRAVCTQLAAGKWGPAPGLDGFLGEIQVSGPGASPHFPGLAAMRWKPILTPSARPCPRGNPVDRRLPRERRFSPPTRHSPLEELPANVKLHDVICAIRPGDALGTGPDLRSESHDLERPELESGLRAEPSGLRSGGIFRVAWPGASEPSGGPSGGGATDRPSEVGDCDPPERRSGPARLVRHEARGARGNPRRVQADRYGGSRAPVL